MRFIFVTLNNADQAVSMDLKTEDCTEYIGALTGEKVSAKGGRIRVKVAANYGEIWIPEEIFDKSIAPIKPMEIIKKSPKMQVRKNEQTKMKTTVPLPVERIVAVVPGIRVVTFLPARRRNLMIFMAGL